VKKTGRETTIAEIGKILNHSAEYKTQTQLNGEIWADKAVVPQIGLAAISWPAFGINGMGGILKQSFGNIIRILVSLDTINHLTIASRNRILIKQGQALENLGNIDTVLFDKTGTLTTGQLQVTKDVGITLNEKTILSTMKRGHGELADLMDTLTFIKKEELHILEQFDFHLICNLYTRFLKFFDQRTVFL
jgi:cation transport ATPase